MPVDPSIALGVRPAQFDNPLAVAMQMSQFRAQQENTAALAEQRRLLAQQRESAINDQAALDQAVVPGATLDAVLSKLPGHMHAKIREDYAKADKAAADAAKARSDAAIADADFKGEFAAQWKSYGFDPQAGQVLLDIAKKHGHDLSDVEAQLQRGAQPTQIADALIAASPKQRELATGEQNAASSATQAKTSADRLAVETPGIVARGQVDQQVAAGTVGGMTPAQQATQKQVAAQQEIEQARLRFERTKFAAESGEALDLSPEAKTLLAKQFAMTGQLVPMGMGKQAAKLRTEVINEAARMYTGLDLASQQAAYSANKSALVKLRGQREALGAFESTALKNLDVFLSLAAKVPDSGSPALNQPMRYANEKMFGGDTLTAFNTARRTVIPEFAKILSNPGLSGQLSDTARKEIEDVVSGNATLKQTIAAARILKTDAANRRTAYDDQISGIEKLIATPPGSQSGAVDTKAPAGGAAPFSYADYLKAKGKT
jgi:hypothetical protein